MKFFVSALLVFSTLSWSQPEPTSEQDMAAELYADYVSHKAFSSKCDALNNDERFQKIFEKWVSKNKIKINSGYETLKQHYSAQNLEVNEVFKWKTEAELRYFSKISPEEKSLVCKRLEFFISE